MPDEPTDAQDGASRNALRWAVTLVAMGIIVRIVIAWFSWGSNDATTWLVFAEHAAHAGVLRNYEIDPDYNHPPLPGLWAAAVYRITDRGVDEVYDPSTRRIGLTFPFVFKTIDFVADTIVCILLWKILRRRSGPKLAAVGAVGFAWALNSILMTGHHCNTDPVHVMFSLLAVYLIEAHRKDLLGGLALAAAINVKLLPILLILPLALSYHDWRRFWRFLLGLSLGVIPFVPVLIWHRQSFYRNAIAYGSSITHWGVNHFLLDASHEPRFSAVALAMIRSYYTTGRWIVLASILLLALYARGTRRLDRYHLAACATALFLVLTPGFGIQYTVMPLAFLFATGRLTPAIVYGFTAGMMLLLIYWMQWTGTWPFDTYSVVGPRATVPPFGILAWATLVFFVFTELRLGHYTPHADAH